MNLFWQQQSEEPQKSRNTVLRMEDLDDENTYVVYDAENHKLMLQLEAEGKKAADFKVYLNLPTK